MPLADPVLVLADQADDDDVTTPTQATRELLTLARRIGAPVLVNCPAEEAAEALIEIAERTHPRAILITADQPGEMISAHVSVRLESPIITDVTDLSLDDGRILTVQESAHGTGHITSEIHRAPVVITMCPRPRRRAPVLSEADVVVVGGRGVGSAEGFSLLARLANELGACLGSTHTAGELGWAPRHACISLPGAQIRPRLYVAGGVSGSLRHRAAIRRARTVVAIDSDPEAPILREADFGIVGDLHRVLPAVLEELALRASSTGSDPFPISAEA
jgi:electron transfer flavoprotein alpha subunit